MINNSDKAFNSIDSEIYRVYEYRDGYKITILNPTHLNVSKSGGHRVLDKQGVSHYIMPGWVHLYWEVYEGHPNFVL